MAKKKPDIGMFRRLRAKLPELSALLESVNNDWVYQDLVYRFWHQSFKVYRIQDYTQKMVDALQSLTPDHPLNPWFMEIVQQGTGQGFDLSHNDDWLRRGRPMLEAFFHARFMLEMAVKHGPAMKENEEQQQWIDSGWAAFLCLYGLR